MKCALQLALLVGLASCRVFYEYLGGTKRATAYMMHH